MLYQVHCVQCHGLGGKGDGTAAQYLPRRPRDFTDGLYKIKTSPPTTMLSRDEDIYYSITRGMSIAGMPPWEKVLTDKQRWDLVAYLKSLSDLYDDEPNPEPLDLSGRVPPSPESVKRGNRGYFKLLCHECHGEKGQGPSIKKLRDDYGDRIWPRDLTRTSTFIGPATPEAIYARVTNGIPLTPMPSHVKNPKDDQLEDLRWDIANYIVWQAAKAQKLRRERMLKIAGVTLIILGASWIFIRRRKAKRDRSFQ